MIPELFTLLAETTPEKISPAAVGVIIGSIIASLFSAGLIGKKMGEGNVKAHIVNDPVMVRMAEEFVPRREFEKLEVAVSLNCQEAKALFAQTMAAIAQQNQQLTRTIENQNGRLTKKIEEFGSSAFRGRKEIWEQVNEQRDRLAAVEVHTDVASKLQKLGDSIEKLASQSQQ